MAKRRKSEPTAKKLIVCSPRRLPRESWLAAAETAIRENAANRPAVERLASLMGTALVGPSSGPTADVISQHIAVLTTKYWHGGGVKLTVGFMEQTQAALADKILSYMNRWGARCNVQFAVVQGSPSKAQVRISRKPGGYWSYLGTDVLQIPSNQPTMNLEAFSLSTPDAEYSRVVTHETGHTLGCPHEHMRREIIARINQQKAIQFFQQTQGWSQQEVVQQVLTPLEESSLMGTAHADETSIMCYQLPGQITNDGRPIPGGANITEADYQFMATIYPKPTDPPGNPPPSGGGTWKLTLPNGAVLSGTGAPPTVQAA